MLLIQSLWVIHKWHLSNSNPRSVRSDESINVVTAQQAARNSSSYSNLPHKSCSPELCLSYLRWWWGKCKPWNAAVNHPIKLMKEFKPLEARDTGELLSCFLTQNVALRMRSPHHLTTGRFVCMCTLREEQRRLGQESVCNPAPFKWPEVTNRREQSHFTCINMFCVNARIYVYLAALNFFIIFTLLSKDSHVPSVFQCLGSRSMEESNKSYKAFILILSSDAYFIRGCGK